MASAGRWPRTAKRWRVVDHLQALRIAGLADGDQRDAEVLRGFDLTLGRFARKDLRRRCAATASQRGQRLERRAGAAEVIEQGAERARPQYYGPCGVWAIILRGPTFWLRMRRSQSRRCSSVKRMAFAPSFTRPPTRFDNRARPLKILMASVPSYDEFDP
jgi:hypothetical protein